MNIYQCVNYLQGNIDWTINAVNDVVKSWNTVVSESIDQSKAIVRETTTEQFNIEWQKNKTQLNDEIEGMIQEQLNQDWQEKENAINTKINVVRTDLETFKTETNTTISQNQSDFNTFKEETNTKFTTTENELKELINTTLNSIYPVGSVYISLTSTNPGTYLRGTWEQFAQGRTLIGVGSGNDGENTQSFTVNNTGGKYKHFLSKNELGFVDYGALLQQMVQ